MAVEAKRGCGYRKVGGLYLVGGGSGINCCKLPILLHICPTCNQGVKQGRGWQWIDPKPWLTGACTGSGVLPQVCPSANPEQFGERVGLLWIGEKFYPTPADFSKEAQLMGVSRRIKTIPRGFKVGESWVFFAHPKVQRAIDERTDDFAELREDGEKWLPGIFRIFLPTKLERLMKETDKIFCELATAGIAEDPAWETKNPLTEQSQKLLAEYTRDMKAGVTWVAVPDNDKDHQGTAYDKAEEDEDQPELVPV